MLLPVAAESRRWRCSLPPKLVEPASRRRRSEHSVPRKSSPRTFRSPLSSSPISRALINCLNRWQSGFNDGAQPRVTATAGWCAAGCPNNCQSTLLLPFPELRRSFGGFLARCCCWSLAEKFVNFIWEAAIFSSCEATSKFIGLYVTSEREQAWRRSCGWDLNLLLFLRSSWCWESRRYSQGISQLPSISVIWDAAV